MDDDDDGGNIADTPRVSHRIQKQMEPYTLKHGKQIESVPQWQLKNLVCGLDGDSTHAAVPQAQFDHVLDPGR